MKAIWNNTILADSNNTKLIEQNYYFPPSSIRMEYLKKSGSKYTCPWKGMCDYYHIVVDGEVNTDAAWVYEYPKEAAKEISGYFAFWKGIKIIP